MVAKIRPIEGKMVVKPVRLTTRPVIIEPCPDAEHQWQQQQPCLDAEAPRTTRR